MILGGTHWRGVVTEDGQRFLADHHAAFRRELARYAGGEVVLRLARPLTPNQRGYWHAEIVPRYCELTGEPLRLVGHYQLLHLLDWTPGAERPSTADDVSDGDEMADRIARAQAFLTLQGLDVRDPEPDPIRRLERALARNR